MIITQPIQTNRNQGAVQTPSLLAFDNIVFDLDSTLTTIEGIDELARMNGCYEAVRTLTDQAMNGTGDLDSIFKKRLKLISPTRDHLITLGERYCQHLTPGAMELVSLLHQNHKRVFIVSGGYDPAVSHVAQHLGIPSDRVFANKLVFTADGVYQSLDPRSILWQPFGKVQIIETLKQTYPGNWVMIGDGASDLETVVVVDEFICFTGVISRKNVTNQSNYLIHSFVGLQ